LPSTPRSSTGSKPEEEVERMRSGEEPLDPRAGAIYALARAIVLHRG
jgi:hypothetical protein